MRIKDKGRAFSEAAANQCLKCELFDKHSCSKRNILPSGLSCLLKCSDLDVLLIQCNIWFIHTGSGQSPGGAREAFIHPQGRPRASQSSLQVSVCDALESQRPSLLISGLTFLECVQDSGVPHQALGPPGHVKHPDEHARAEPGSGLGSKPLTAS